MANPITVTVQIDTNPLSPNRINGRHWRGVKRLKDAARWAAHIAYVQAGKPVADYPVTVYITVRRKRKMDEDNLLSSCKVILDTLFKQAITSDDAPQFVQIGGVSQETGWKWNTKPEVELRIERRIS